MYTHAPTGLIFVCAMISLTLGGMFDVAHAQEDFEQPEVFFDEDHDPSELVPFRAEPWQEVQGSVADSFYGIIYYDVYERAYRVEDFFPLGYSATVNYQYYSRLFERERDGFVGWEPVVSRETGAFMRGGEQIASYVKTFDTAGNQTSYTREGFSVVVPIMQTIGALLGIELRNPDDI